MPKRCPVSHQLVHNASETIDASKPTVGDALLLGFASTGPMPNGASGDVAFDARFKRSKKPSTFFWPTPGVDLSSSSGRAKRSRSVRSRNAIGRGRPEGGTQKERALWGGPA